MKNLMITLCLIANLSFGAENSLHLLVENENISTIKALIDSTNVNQVDKYGRTPLHIAAEIGNIEIVELLLENGALLQPDIWKDTPLDFAAYKGHVEIAELLVKKGGTANSHLDSEVNALHKAVSQGWMKVVTILLDAGSPLQRQNRHGGEHGSTPLHNAVIHTEIVKLLLDRGACVDARDNDGKSPLHHAISENQAESIKMLSDRGADIHALDCDGNSVLHFAVRKDIDIMKFLLARGANPKDINYYYESPLSRAVEYGLYDMCSLHLENGANVNSGFDKLTPLHEAVRNQGERGLDLVQLLLDHGANIHALNCYGATPLHFALEQYIPLLLAKGAVIDQQDKDGKTPLHYATERDDKEAVNTFIRYGASTTIKNQASYFKDFCRPESPIHLLAKNEQLEGLKVLMDSFPINAMDECGRTPLHEAAATGNREIVALLLDKGARIQADYWNDTPLDYAAKEGHLPIVALLAEKGGKANTHYDSKVNALHVAASKGWFRIVEILLNQGSPTHRKDRFDRQTALHHAIAYPDIVELLLARGSVIDERDDMGESPLFRAIEKDKQEVAKLLINRGADIHALNISGKSMLHICLENQSEFIKLLIARGINPKIVDYSGASPLHIFIHNNFFDHAKFLLENGADANAFEKWCQNTPLHKAVIYQQSLDVVRLLLDHGANVNALDSFKQTPLHFAIAEYIPLLVERGAQINQQDDLGRTPLHAAAFEYRPDSIKTLIKLGASPTIKDQEGKTFLDYDSLIEFQEITHLLDEKK